MGQESGKRRQILDAAVEEFLEHGFGRAGMDRIAARAEVSKRTVYNHFESKDALFHAILDRMIGEVAMAVDIRFDPARPVRDQLVELGRAEGRLFANPDFMRLARMVFGETMRDPALAEEMTAKMEDLSVFRDFMADAGAAGALRVEVPERSASQFIGMIKAQSFWPSITSGAVVGAEEMERIVQTSADVFLSGAAP